MRRLLAALAVSTLWCSSASANVVAAGNITASGSTCDTGVCVSADLGDKANGSFQLTGFGSATVQFEATNDGTTWVALNTSPVNASTVVTSATAANIYSFSGSFKTVRARASAYSSGTIVATISTGLGGGGGGGGGGAAGAVTQGTTPWVVDGSAVTQPVSGSVTASGTVTANQGGTWTVQPGNTANTTAWKVDGSAVTQPVSGTVTTTPPSNASENVAQFGGTNVSTGTGAGGAGIPRVTVSSDTILGVKDVQDSGGTTMTDTGVHALQISVVKNTVGSLTLTDAATQTAGQANVAAMEGFTFGFDAINNVWRRMQVDPNGLLLVSSGTASPSVVKAGAPTVLQTGQLDMAAVTNTPPVYQPGTSNPLSMNTLGMLRVDPSGVQQNVAILATSKGGTATSRTVAAGTTNATLVQGGPGQVYAIQASNVNAAARFLHLYDTGAVPSCGSNIKGTWIIPGNATGAGTNIEVPTGIAFTAGIGFCITTANDGTGSVTASDVVLMIEYR